MVAGRDLHSRRRNESTATAGGDGAKAGGEPAARKEGDED
jgi:hypothetical protein